MEDVRNAVAPEVQIGISRSGLLRLNDFNDTDLGPLFIFDQDPRSVRLNLVLKDTAPVERLYVIQRLNLIRQPTEILRYTQEKSKRIFPRRFRTTRLTLPRPRAATPSRAGF